MFDVIFIDFSVF